MRFWKKKEKIKLADTGLNISAQEWRSDSGLVSQAAQILSLQYVKWMVDVLRAECPSRRVYMTSHSLEARALSQAEAQGWNLCIETLLSLGKESGARKTLPDETFEPSNQE